MKKPYFLRYGIGYLVAIVIVLLLWLDSAHCSDVTVFGHHWSTIGKVHVHKHSVTFKVSKREDDNYLTSKDLMGYGKYTMTFKVSPNKSGAVAAGYSYLPYSETEIDVEEQGVKPGEVEFTNWVTPLMGTMCRAKFLAPTKLHTFSYVWTPRLVTYFVDGVKVCEAVTTVPTKDANFIFEFYSTDDASWGGKWVKAKRRMTVTDFKFEPWLWRQQ